MIVPSLRYRKKARIEIIPLIDIVFFLLATFVMVSLSMVKNQGIAVNLPQAGSATRQSKGSDYTAITVTKAGEIFYNKARVNLDQLRVNLKDLKTKQTDPLVLLNGDDQASLGKAVEVLDEARKLGIKRVAIQTRQT